MYNTTVILRRSYRNTFLVSKMCSAMQNNSVESSIKKKLIDSLNPSYIEIINESYMHNVPKGSETHFKIIAVSDKFKDVPLIKRHRMINKLLQSELEGSVHALSIIAKTPDQWKEKSTITPSPACRGGFGK
ncbi:DNA-binding transcriptional regulator BolA [Bombus vosnesenskii]|uniref:DNA-binding transcriptional regulator BolA n=1 Tax=Bombus vosnesenskii TaxID=207650 RepID=A0A6J3K2J9_9HYME|nr:DNA-binding transcriptional regulator BolA [Bombus vosnesenskii]